MGPRMYVTRRGLQALADCLGLPLSEAPAIAESMGLLLPRPRHREPAREERIAAIMEESLATGRAPAELG